ncbi:hypothetical protein ACFQ1E_13875 [Sphingomonas canadensis]|uniref:Uncharacterized protein n=1 Tax=Sphingomonas canadensis TaxID=1219257 RepID=A0ABW3H7Y7_9SPHN|nr:hypothetical protein [Sphingomonas canadensis]MCW3837328.1 hypothetical protein [Sphingomonas canadensis]
MASHTDHSSHQGDGGRKSGCCGGKADAGRPGAGQAKQPRPEEARPASGGGCCGSKP